MPDLRIRPGIFVICGLLILVPLALSFSQSKELRKVTFLPGWVPQSQFAGYYMAKNSGIYEKYGLDVTIVEGGMSRDVITALKNREIDFGTAFLYTGVIERARGTTLVNIGQMFQQSAIMFVAKKKSGIKSLDDFNGKRIGVWRTVLRELTSGFLAKHHIRADVVEINSGIGAFLKDAVDITVMMNYNEYKRMLNSGIDPDEVAVFEFAGYGMNFPEDGIYCMESTLKKDPASCKSFVDASIEGWKYALEHPDETLDVLHACAARAKVSANRSQSLWMLNSMKEMMYPSNRNTREGVLLESDFDSLTGFLYSNGFIAAKPVYNDFYRNIR
jgi:NitT/TauT family transport system substrate-binding protein